MRATQVTSSPSLKFVIARFMRATHRKPASKIAMGGPDKPGHDENGLERAEPTWVARIRGP
jgi:hypothetical protein